MGPVCGGSACIGVCDLRMGGSCRWVGSMDQDCEWEVYLDGVWSSYLGA